MPEVSGDFIEFELIFALVTAMTPRSSWRFAVGDTFFVGMTWTPIWYRFDKSVWELFDHCPTVEVCPPLADVRDRADALGAWLGSIAATADMVRRQRVG